MARGIHKLSAKEVVNASKPGLYSDGGGLYLQVSQWQTKAWIFRFMMSGRSRKMGLGPFPTVSLEKARKVAVRCREEVQEGRDPIEVQLGRKAELRVASAKRMTFRQCAEAYILAHRSGWKNEKHRAQWPSTLESYVYPTIGDLPVEAIDVSLVLKVVEPIWSEKPETASRVRGRIEKILDWATSRDHRKGDNPARWKSHLEHHLAERGSVARVKHHAALPYHDAATFMLTLRHEIGVSARALEFAILTAARTGEVVGARWSEIDTKTRLWIVPPERMKGRKGKEREHRVPLSDRALAILDALPREDGGEFVFIGGKKGQSLSNMALLMTLRRMGRTDITAHGFRSTFKDWATEQTAYPNEMTEIALAHVVSDKTEAAYRRMDMVEKRRRLMADWAAFCSAPVSASADNVVAMRSGT